MPGRAIPRASEEVAPQHASSDDGDAVLLMGDLLKHWKGTALMCIGGGALFLGASFFAASEYRSRATFIPEQRERSAGAASAFLGLASQLGVGLAGNGQTPQLYADLIRSANITDSVLSAPLPTALGGAILAEVLVPGARPRTAGWERARAQLGGRTAATLNPRTNVIELAVRMRDPAIAQFTARQYIASLTRFNRASRQSSARARREFLGRRLAETQDSLRTAEDALTQFMGSNRTYDTSPTLRYTRDRLQRRLDGAQEVFVTLRREFESARLDEVNDQPLLTVIDEPSLPMQRMSKHRAAYLAFGLGLGCMAALISALGRVTFMRIRLDDPRRFERLSQRFGGLPLVGRWMRTAASEGPPQAAW